MRSARLDEYQHAVVWHDDLFLFGMAVIERYDLTRYDKEEMKMSNSCPTATPGKVLLPPGPWWPITGYTTVGCTPPA